MMPVDDLLRSFTSGMDVTRGERWLDKEDVCHRCRS